MTNRKSNVEKIKTLKAKGGKKKTRKQLAQEMYKYYIADYKAGKVPAPIGSNTPLTESEYCRRQLYGIGGASGSKRKALEWSLQKKRHDHNTTKVVKDKKKVTLKKAR